MLLFLIALLLLNSILTTAALRDYDLDLWSSAESSSYYASDVLCPSCNENFNNNLQNQGYSYGDNNFNDYDDQMKSNYGSPFQSNTFSPEIPNESTEEVYVFLNKGQVRYFPLNENGRAETKRSTININGVNVNLNERTLLRKLGLICENRSGGKPDTRQYKQKKKHFGTRKRDCKYNNKRKNFNPYHTQTKSYLNTQRDSNSNVNNYQSVDLSPNQWRKNNFYKKKFEKNYEDDENFRTWNNFQRNKFNNKAPKNMGNECPPQHQENKIISTNTATVQQNIVEMDQTDILLGRPHMENQTIKQSEIASNNDEASILYLKSGDAVRINDDLLGSPFPIKGNAIFVAKEHEPMNSIKKSSTSSNSANKSQTDSPIYYIKIIPHNSAGKEDKLKYPQRVNETLSTAKSSVTEDKSSNTSFLAGNANNLGDKVINVNNVDLNQEYSKISTEVSFGKNMFTGLEDDLSQSEDRLVEYITKMENQSQSSSKETKKIKRQAKYMEPISYETLQMQSNNEAELNNLKRKKNYLSKPKRNVQLRALNPKSPSGSKHKKPKSKSSKKTTTNPKNIDKPKIQFKSQAKERNENSAGEREKTLKSSKKNKKKVYDKSTPKSSDSQILGSNRFISDSEDLCSNSKKYSDGSIFGNDKSVRSFEQPDEPSIVMLKPGELQNAEMKILSEGQDDCDDTTDVILEGDRFLEIADVVTPAQINQLSDFC